MTNRKVVFGLIGIAILGVAALAIVRSRAPLATGPTRSAIVMLEIPVPTSSRPRYLDEIAAFAAARGMRGEMRRVTREAMSVLYEYYRADIDMIGGDSLEPGVLDVRFYRAIRSETTNEAVEAFADELAKSLRALGFDAKRRS